MSHKDEMTRLGYYGVAPFVFGAAILWLAPAIIPINVAVNVQELLLAYGVVVAVFLAGMNAGVSLKSLHMGPVAPLVLAALVALAALVLAGPLAPAALRYALLTLVLVWLLSRDLNAGSDFPAWYGPLRTRLTFWALASLTLIMVRLVTW